MLAAPRAKLLGLQPILVLLFVLHGGVVALFALTTL
jgi:hypothetical protein